MADIFMYADETGDLDLTGKPGASQYFGFGTATFAAEHGHAMWQGFRLRCRLEQQGIRLPQGFHAKEDTTTTRNEVFALIKSQAPRLDTTFLFKPNAYGRVKERGQPYLYKMAWFLHFKEIALQVSSQGDTLFVIAGSMKTYNKREAIRHALEDVCSQVGRTRTIVPCIWDAQSAWGIQVADYALWAVQRNLAGGSSGWYVDAVKPTLRSTFLPWGGA